MNTLANNAVPGRILIIRLSSIGDVVRTLPALSSLRRQYPNAHIGWAVEDKSSGILEGHPHLDEIVIFERTKIVHSLRNPLRSHEGLSLLARFFREIRRAKYDLVLDFHGILKSGLIAISSRSPNRVGFEKDFVKEFNHLLTNRKVVPADARLSRVTRNLELIKPFVLPENLTDEAVLGMADKHRNKASAFISETFGNSHPLVAVHSGTSRNLKKWPLASFAKLCDLLVESTGARVVLTWGPGELGEVEEIRSLAKTRPDVGMQTNSLLELAALLEMCDLMITVDSGPMHIGSAVGTPVVAIFGPTDIRVNSPYWPPHEVVSSNIDCCPCDENCDFARCMDKVTPENVFETARELLTQTRVKAPR
ncbi:MAG: glycosyltransferase family 9 protein [Candidatus Hydrogenedentota bacterium]|nr:MAG: glycosyltransferase family 9 protein [Candidatus Hydrogenedentota bacterium]